MTPEELAHQVCRLLEQKGYQALLVGGCVRDLLLGRKPADFDVTTDALPSEVIELFPESLGVGAQFGVVLVHQGGSSVEVATFRTDRGYGDGRHPDRVEYSRSADEDVLRRDFTINGLLMRHTSGEVLDFVGGRRDLEAKLVRAIGDPARRFAEDKLRMVRAVRFAARFGFEIETETARAIRREAGRIGQLSAERLRDELTKILTEGAARRGFELLDQTGLLGQLLPEIEALKGVAQPPEYHPEGDVWTHTRLMLEKIPPGASPTLAWGVLLHDVGKPPTFRSAEETGDRIRFDKHVEVGVRMAEAIAGRLRFSGAESGQIVSLVSNHMKFKDVGSMKSSTLKRFVRQPNFEEHLELHRLDCLGSHRRLESYERVRKFLAETPPEQVRPPRLLTGEELKEMGYQPGRLFASILALVEEAQLEGQIETVEQAKSLVRSSFGPPGADTKRRSGAS